MSAILKIKNICYFCKDIDCNCDVSKYERVSGVDNLKKKNVENNQILKQYFRYMNNTTLPKSFKNWIIS